MKRNELCYCGSGMPYAECHGKEIDRLIDPMLFENLPPKVKEKFIKWEKRKEEQGAVRNMISLDFQGFKTVAVGNQLFFSKKWKTFPDFLFDYIKKVLGPDWGNTELKKPFEEQHVIIQWYKSLCEFQKKHFRKEGDIYSATCTGTVGAYLSLAYDLYVLRHHSLLQQQLIDRLKNKQQFQGARYEIYVTSSFIKAGFNIEFENESDKSKSHCEFIATHTKSGKKYSVEAKSRHRSGFLGFPGERIQSHDNVKLRIGNLINEALSKKADFVRVIFIDINMPPQEGIVFKKPWMKTLFSKLNEIESKGIAGNNCPPAYVFFTNHPYHYVGEDEIEPSKNFLMTGLNIPTMKVNDFSAAMQQEPPVFILWESINKHNKVPNDFE
jgi:uncharacterized protein YchJ